EVLAFLRDVKDHPDEDAPRLVLADWLTEHDDPRGEFLRAEVMSARLGWRQWERRHLDACAQELLRQHGDDWLGPLRGVSFYPKWERGMLRLALGPDKLPELAACDPEADERVAWVDGLSTGTLGETGGVWMPQLLRLPLLP